MYAGWMEMEIYKYTLWRWWKVGKWILDTHLLLKPSVYLVSTVLHLQMNNNMYNVQCTCTSTNTFHVYIKAGRKVRTQQTIDELRRAEAEEGEKKLHISFISSNGLTCAIYSIRSHVTTYCQPCPNDFIVMYSAIFHYAYMHLAHHAYTLGL